MFLITIKTGEQGQSPLKLETTERHLARACVKICEENKLECDVVKEVKPQSVKFR